MVDSIFFRAFSFTHHRVGNLRNSSVKEKKGKSAKTAERSQNTDADCVDDNPQWYYFSRYARRRRRHRPYRHHRPTYNEAIIGYIVGKSSPSSS